MGKPITDTKTVETSGYYLYEDGNSIWGINIYRSGTFGVKITQEQHNIVDKEQKITIYKEIIAKENAAKAEAERIEKEREKASGKARK